MTQPTESNPDEIPTRFSATTLLPDGVACGSLEDLTEACTWVLDRYRAQESE